MTSFGSASIIAAMLETVNDPIQGCGKDDRPLTLYRVSDGAAPPTPLSGSYFHIRCGYRPQSKPRNGILLCDVCVAKLELPALNPHLAPG